MQTELLKSLGNFDDIIIDGRLGKFNSISLLSHRSFKDLLLDKNKVDINIEKLRIKIIGKYNETASHNICGDSCTISYIDIVIINGITFEIDDIENCKQIDDIKDLLKVASKLSSDYIKKNGTDKTNIKSAIIDKIYTDKNYRNKGIATWIHNNIIELIEYYSGLAVSILVLKSGDFTNELEINGLDYIQYLNKHYKNLGYSELDFIKRKLLGVGENIFYKIF